jgi:type III pantothenate kinase
MQVLIDIGNTRMKWALLDGGRLVQPGHALHRGASEEALALLAAALPQETTRVLVANVAGEIFARRIDALSRAHCGVAAEFVATAAEQFGVRCAYAEPARLGVDRWVAVLAAHHLASGAAYVIDAGTAVTFDAVDAQGRHLGGLIFAGRQLQAATLDRNTSNIGATPPPSAAPAGLELLGTSTAAAVGQGAMLALAAALDRAVATVDKALATQATVYLTGGDGAVLRGWLETKVELRADLVLEGLARFADSPALSSLPRSQP